MPSNFYSIESSFPAFTGEETGEEKIDSVLNYLRMLVDQLRYTLNNLDSTNFNTRELNQIKQDTVKDIKEETGDLASTVKTLSEAVNALSGTVNTMTGTVRTLGITVSDVQEDLDTVRKDVDEGLSPGVEALQAAIQIDEHGNIVIGGQGLTVELTGAVTVNGSPV